MNAYETEARAVAFKILETLAARPGARHLPGGLGAGRGTRGQLLILRQMVEADEGGLRILEPRHDFLDYYASSIGHLIWVPGR